MQDVFGDIMAQERVQLQKLLKYLHRFPILLTSDVYGAYEKYLSMIHYTRTSFRYVAVNRMHGDQFYQKFFIMYEHKSHYITILSLIFFRYNLTARFHFRWLYNRSTKTRQAKERNWKEKKNKRATTNFRADYATYRAHFHTIQRRNQTAQ